MFIQIRLTETENNIIANKALRGPVAKDSHKADTKKDIKVILVKKILDSFLINSGKKKIAIIVRKLLIIKKRLTVDRLTN